jgi:hypothetical protein
MVIKIPQLMKKIFIHSGEQFAESSEFTPHLYPLLNAQFDHAAEYSALIDYKSSLFLAESGAADILYDHAVIFEHMKYRNVIQSMMNDAQSSMAEPHHSDASALALDHAIVFRRMPASSRKKIWSSKNQKANNKTNFSQERTSFIEENMRDGILIVHDFLNKQECKALVDYASVQESVAGEVADYENSDEDGFKTKQHKSRVTDVIDIDGRICEFLNLFNDIYCHKLASFYDVDFEWYERPAILRYSVGGKYDRHNDANRWDKEKRKWVRSSNRDYSILLYLNEEYEAGEIEFTRQRYKIKPKTGMLVAFPSDHRYMHAALPVASGVRYVIVSWAAIMGSKRVRKMYSSSVYLRQKRLK